jgi:hypothetical protein
MIESKSESKGNPKEKTSMVFFCSRTKVIYAPRDKGHLDRLDRMDSLKPHIGL